MRTASVFLLASVALLNISAVYAAQPLSLESAQKATLGQQLFFDVNLSQNRTQSCASCHAPDKGFSDHRGLSTALAASLGDDGKSLGDRNAPSASYAAFSPHFQKTSEGVFKGGQFWDGRADSLTEQAGGPPLNPGEMGLANKASAVDRIQENSQYQVTFKDIYGDAIFEDADKAYAAMSDAIAAFEESEFFSPFDAKYDRYLRGEYQLTPQEDLGRTLFFSQQFTNCNLCHQLRTLPEQQKETFSNYEFHNIGVPANTALRAINGATQVDQGLLNHPDVEDLAQRGKFKTPTLRNVAVTGPYMHNGVFTDLRTVVLFYNKYNSRSVKRQINPETGEQWREPEIAQTLSRKELETGPALDDKRIDALVAFLKTLTDKKYE
ncbi:cytochrome-c peroxidase [Neptunomonas japonica]|uniref:Methylamine utilization protein MauG n=1 Tax=Neptunomonas japonica JAMM 1380 TaxID=1441457 RepID=A0A7R6PF61_9GAMM|nr:cytochrome c peroxidase [Neptunomonas japonica]BBB27996.1 methylamine utilization protein MauG [Neptunomonas japonica JAMM 1380]